jgi:hypothetical protein
LWTATRLGAQEVCVVLQKWFLDAIKWEGGVPITTSQTGGKVKDTVDKGVPGGKVVEAVSRISKEEYNRVMGYVERIHKAQQELEREFREVKARADSDITLEAIRKLVDR